VDLRAGATLGLGTGLRLRTSTVPASGLGVFVTRAVKAGARITEVSGTVISDFGVRSLSKVQREGVAALFVGWPALEKRLYILGDRGPQFLPCSPLGSMVNDAGSARAANARFSLTTHRMPGVDRPGLETNRRLWIRSLRDLRAGEEILLCYCGTFWMWHAHGVFLSL